MPEISRRGLLTGLVTLVAAPAIVRASSLMKVRVIDKSAAFNLEAEIAMDVGTYRGVKFYVPSDFVVVAQTPSPADFVFHPLRSITEPEKAGIAASMQQVLRSGDFP